MSDNIPFEIQMEIIKWLPVKPLIQFRSVSKPWKCVIDSSEFINGYGARHTHPHSRILSCRSGLFSDGLRYTCLVDDDIETFKVQQQESAPFVVPPSLKQYFVHRVVGACHGLLCFYGYHRGYRKRMVVIWNPSIEKSFAISAPIAHDYHYGFGVCPVTKDPTIVKIKHKIGTPWNVEVFTLSSCVWSVIPSSNILFESVRIDLKIHRKTQVIIDRFIYWVASDKTSADAKYIILSFDLITKEFKVVDVPDSLRNELHGGHVCLAKLRESLVVYGPIYVNGAECCGVWVMQHGSSFNKLFTIRTRGVIKILGFGKSGETVFENRMEGGWLATLDVYNSRSQQIKNLGISGVDGSFFMGSYKESLLLLDQSDSYLHIHYDNN